MPFAESIPPVTHSLMLESPHPDQIEFRILPEDGGNEVPVALLMQGLQGLQQLIHFSALAVENKTVRQRVRVSSEIQRRYTLHCRPPETGSFRVAGRVGDLDPSLVETGNVAGVMGLVHDFSHATLEGNEARLISIVADSRLRVRMLDCLRSMAPPPGAGYAFEFQNCVGPPVRLDEALSARIESVLRPVEIRQRISTITGQLLSISFSEHKLSLLYAPKGRTLECLYDESLEPMLFENRRDLIQVTGQVVDADDGHPRQIVEVSRIEELDLSPFVITELEEGVTLIKPLRLEPFLSDDEQLLRLEHPDLDIDVFAHTRTDLWNELRGQLGMLWQEYGMEDDDRLSGPALSLKLQLTQLVKHQADVTR
jgi:hypothetical protein